MAILNSRGEVPAIMLMTGTRLKNLKSTNCKKGVQLPPPANVHANRVTGKRHISLCDCGNPLPPGVTKTNMTIQCNICKAMQPARGERNGDFK